MFTACYTQNHSQKGQCVYTRVAWKKGDVIHRMEGDIFTNEMANALKSISLNRHFSFELSKGWQTKLNHSCDPNCFMDLNTGYPILTAWRDIKAGEELSYNYNTVELDLQKDWTSFPCHCGHKDCIGWIRGFMYLTVPQERQILHLLSPYLKEIREIYEKDRDK